MMWIVLVAMCAIDPATGRDICRSMVVPQFFATLDICEASKAPPLRGVLLATSNPAGPQLRWVNIECHNTNTGGT